MDCIEEPLLELSKPIPDHSEDLCRASLILSNILNDYKKTVENRSMTGNQHEILYERTMKVLYFIGNLSLSLFEFENEIIEKYTMKYLSDPALAKKLSYMYYQKIHRKYDLLKNKCFRLLDKIDDNYILLNKKYPPNYYINNLDLDREDYQNSVLLTLLGF